MYDQRHFFGRPTVTVVRVAFVQGANFSVIADFVTFFESFYGLPLFNHVTVSF